MPTPKGPGALEYVIAAAITAILVGRAYVLWGEPSGLGWKLPVLILSAAATALLINVAVRALSTRKRARNPDTHKTQEEK